MNARDDTLGLIHEVKREPNKFTHEGFTGCRQFFTWVDGSRLQLLWHSTTSRYVKTEDASNCIECIGSADR